MPKKWLRKKDVCARYGDIVPRSVERAVKERRLPHPEYPLGNDVPFWDEEKLDEHDRKIVKERIEPVAEETAETAA